jgi:hypothetical protein
VKKAITPSLSQSFYTLAEGLAYQRVTVAEWRAILLAERDRPIIRGHVRQIVAKRLGAGVMELRLKPLGEEKP